MQMLFAIFELLITPQMHSLYIKISFISWLFVINTVLISCKPTPGTWINEKIPANKQEKFHQLNAELLKTLKANDPRQLENIMSKEFLEAPGNNRLIELCSIRMRDDKNVLLDEYYIVHPTPEIITLKTFKYDINSYSLRYEPLTQERYISLYTLQQNADKWLLTAIFNKYKYGWKVAGLELKPYTIWGKTAPELYLQARQDYDQGYLVNATTAMELAYKCADPNSMWTYDELDDMDGFYNKVITEVHDKYKFPVVLNDVDTKPQIIKIFNQDRGEGNYPMIYYTSKIKVTDTAALKREHEAVKKTIGKVMPGIDKNKKYLYYTVFNGMPDWNKKKIPHFEIEDSYE
ncbi:hypothetical protein [uncultured Mucilaginibacter sp.]|uniref:hypothetical protein n=1 Tax=uncultured Mucilaginibacter sp. TaxID=797541 RepID=UPI0025E73984|nr:hypothetical protein [uncultured Mucilaginibacter sp.]